jgi:hypothetical protein
MSSDDTWKQAQVNTEHYGVDNCKPSEIIELLLHALDNTKPGKYTVINQSRVGKLVYDDIETVMENLDPGTSEIDAHAYMMARFMSYYNSETHTNVDLHRCF